MDIIVTVNHTKQKITYSFCGIQDEPFLSVQEKSDDIITGFAIRFYFWAAHLFMKLDFKETRNKSIGADVLGKEWERLFEPFLYLRTMAERMKVQ